MLLVAGLGEMTRDIPKPRMTDGMNKGAARSEKQRTGTEKRGRTPLEKKPGGVIGAEKGRADEDKHKQAKRILIG